ncbi:MAG: GAF domain-containing protein, partial [Pseudomonadota bacterium]|nr:GAF domain-containing protein [Pseudomonadota bacterium]
MSYNIDLSKQTEALLSLNKTVMSGADFPSVMEAVVQGTLSVLPQADGAVVELREGDEMIYASASGSMSKHVGLRIKMAGSLSGLAIQEEKLLYCADSETDPRVDRAACRRVGLRSMIIAPLIHRHQCLGILKIYSNTVDAFKEQDQIVAQFFVTMIAAGFGSVVDAQAAAIMKEFVNMATHELRTPLTSLKGALELMSGMHNVELPANVQTLLNIALQGSNRLMFLINDLLTVGQMDAGKMAFVLIEESLDDMLACAVNDMSSYRKNVAFRLETTAPGIKIAVDRNRFLQDMANLTS